MRATVQYRDALRYWKPGQEVSVLTHLFMGMEALKPVAVDRQCLDSGSSKEQLGQQWGFREDGRRSLSDFLQEEARRRILFDNDPDYHRLAKRVSDAVEHGFENFGALRSDARQAVVQTARYLRTAVLRLSSVDAGVMTTLLTAPYAVPVGPLNTIKYLRGKLFGKGPLAAPGAEHPICEWKADIARVYLSEGRYSMDITDNFTTRFREGVVLKDISREVWDGSRLQERPKPEIKKGK